MSLFPYLILALAAFAAGIVNTIAGGGSFLTFPALLLTGLDARAANITSTIALFPMQVSTGYAGRKFAGGTGALPFKALFVISLIGGVIGAGLLLLTPSSIFAKLVPWLVLFATVMFACSTSPRLRRVLERSSGVASAKPEGSFFKRPDQMAHAHAFAKATAGKPHFGKYGTTVIQFILGIYGGYFGGGIGFLMLAMLTLAGMPIRKAGTTKNILVGAMNTSAVLIFLFSRSIAWPQAIIGGVAATLGGLIGTRLLHKVNERILRMAIVVIGTLLTVGLFFRQ